MGWIHKPYESRDSHVPTKLSIIGTDWIRAAKWAGLRLDLLTTAVGVLVRITINHIHREYTRNTGCEVGEVLHDKTS